MNTDCPARTLQSLIHFASRRPWILKDSVQKIEQLHEWHLLNSIEDIYRLHEKEEELLLIKDTPKKGLASCLRILKNPKPIL